MKFKIKKNMQLTQEILLEHNNKNMEYTKKLKYYNSKKQKTWKSLFLSLGIISISAGVVSAFVILIKMAKTKQNIVNEKNNGKK